MSLTRSYVTLENLYVPFNGLIKRVAPVLASPKEMTMHSCGNTLFTSKNVPLSVGVGVSEEEEEEEVASVCLCVCVCVCVVCRLGGR